MSRKEIGWKALSYGAGALAALVTRQAFATVWKGARHESPPRDPADRRVSWTQALTWAIATSVGIGVARVVAARGAAAVWEKTASEPPPVAS
jgi:hypothetical protein